MHRLHTGTDLTTDGSMVPALCNSPSPCGCPAAGSLPPAGPPPPPRGLSTARPATRGCGPWRWPPAYGVRVYGGHMHGTTRRGREAGPTTCHVPRAAASHASATSLYTWAVHVAVRAVGPKEPAIPCVPNSASAATSRGSHDTFAQAISYLWFVPITCFHHHKQHHRTCPLTTARPTISPATPPYRPRSGNIVPWPYTIGSPSVPWPGPPGSPSIPASCAWPPGPPRGAALVGTAAGGAAGRRTAEGEEGGARGTCWHGRGNMCGKVGCSASRDSGWWGGGPPDCGAGGGLLGH